MVQQDTAGLRLTLYRWFLACHDVACVAGDVVVGASTGLSGPAELPPVGPAAAAALAEPPLEVASTCPNDKH